MVVSAPVFSELQKRVVSGLVLFPLAVYLLMVGSPYSDWFIAVFFFLTLVEWLKLVVKTKFSIRKQTVWFLAGFTYIILGFAGFWHISFNFQIAVLAFVSINDIAAYLIGKSLGGKKLAPSISPKKTWAGSIGGFCVTMIVTGITLWHINSALPFSVLIFIAILNVIAQLGDLLESWVKRQFGVKDSGNIIPGHGGVLDRLDSMLAVGIVMLLCHLKYINISQLPI